MRRQANTHWRGSVAGEVSSLTYTLLRMHRDECRNIG